MNRFVRRTAGTPLTEEEGAQLQALALKPDSEIDFSDIPERVYPAADGRDDLKAHTLTLQVDDEVAVWLENAGPGDVVHINNALRREAARSEVRRQAAAGDMLQKAS